jgi:hypothetical protein
MSNAKDAVYLHRTENAGSLAILEHLLGAKKVDWDRLGYEPDDSGARVCWETLYDSYLSTSEINCLRLVEAIARFERHPGLPSTVPADLVYGALSGLARILQ